MLLLVVTSCSKKNTEVDTTCKISGTVIENETGDPVYNATVTLSPSYGNTFTGSDGRFEFIGLEEKQYTVTVQKSGYITNRKIVTTKAGETVNIAITLDKQP